MKDKTTLQDQKIPRYLTLTEDMRRLVRSGQLKPGDRLPSISELRASYGICKSTIERAHLLLEQEGIIVREHGRGTFVSSPDARRASNTTGVIGVYGLLEQWAAGSSYWGLILEGAREALQPHQTDILLFAPHAQGVQAKAAGALINGDYNRPQQQWIDDKWPCVSLLNLHSKDVSSVVADVTTGAREATEYLLKLGHERIAYLHNSNDVSKRNLTGYRQAMQAARKSNPEWVRSFRGPEVQFYEAGVEAMESWLRDGFWKLGCTAIVAHNDGVAAGAIDALIEAGISVPADVSIVGFDGADVCRYTRPRLTTVELPLRQIGQRGAELLLDQIEHGVGEIQHITLPTRLRVRESTAPPAARRGRQIKVTKEAVK